MERRSSLSHTADVDAVQIKSDFLALFDDLAKSRSARLDVQIREKVSDSDILAIVTPVNSRAAKIDARLELDFGVYLLLGQATPFEIPFDRRYYTKGPWLEELRAFCLAVIAGHFRENLIVIKGKVRGSDHEIVLPNGERIVEKWRDGIISPWSKRTLQQVQYEPY
jgi:hypothetical protein